MFIGWDERAVERQRSELKKRELKTDGEEPRGDGREKG